MEDWIYMGDNDNPLYHISYIIMDIYYNIKDGLLGYIGGLSKELYLSGIMISWMDDGETFSFMNIIIPIYIIS
jgi:hypothetical protein